MLDEAMRTAILKLHEQGHGSRMIARALGAARSSVRRVIHDGHARVPALVRAQLAEPWREAILELYNRYEGHLGRVHEQLLEQGASLSYPALTAFCRRHPKLQYQDLTEKCEKSCPIAQFRFPERVVSWRSCPKFTTTRRD